MNEKDYNILIEQMIKYFNVKMVGSYVLYKNGLLKFSDINDLDLFVSRENRKNLDSFLEDNGYLQTKEKGKQIGYAKGSCIYEVIPKGDFKQKNFLNIDVIESSEAVWSVPVIIAEKYKRGTENDYKQLLLIISEKAGVNIQELQHHKDTTVGLYAIDRNPADVDYKWILKNNFQIN